MVHISNNQMYAIPAHRRYLKEDISSDYYLEHDGLRPFVVGKLCGELGLDEGKPITSEQYDRLIDGKHPLTGEQLTQRTNRPDKRRIGTDLTISPDKRITIAGELGPYPEVQRELVETLKDSLRIIEQDVGTRVRRGGANETRDTGNFIALVVFHKTTRPVDDVEQPQYHFHILIFNMTFDHVEGRYKAAELSKLRTKKVLYEQVIDKDIVRRLSSLGFGFRHTDDGRTELACVTDEMVAKFSGRSQQIQNLAAELGIDQNDKQQMGTLGVRTREPKRHDTPIAELRKLWAYSLTDEERELLRDKRGPASEEPSRLEPVAAARPEAERKQQRTDHGEDAEQDQPSPSVDEEPPFGHTFDRPGSDWQARSELFSLSATAAVENAIRILFRRESVVPLVRLKAEALKLSHSEFVEAKQVLDEIDRRRDLHLRTFKGHEFVTTKEAAAEEREIIKLARDLRGRYGKLMNWFLSASYTQLDEYHRELVKEVGASRDGVTIVKLRAGQQREHVVRALHSGFDQAGAGVVHLGANREVSQRLAKDLKLFPELGDDKRPPTVYEFMHTPSERWRAIGLPLAPKVVMVHDAGLLGVTEVNRLLRAAKENRFRLVFVADDKAVGSMSRGHPLYLLSSVADIQTCGARVMRARRNDHQEVVESVVEDIGLGAVGTLKSKGRLHWTSKDEKVLVEAAEQHAEHPRSTLTVVANGRALDQATGVIREKLREKGVIKGKDRSVLQLRRVRLSDAGKRNADRYRKGLVIDFHKNTRGFKSGDRTRVIGVDPTGCVWVWGKAGNPVRLNLRHGDRFVVSEARRAHLAVGDTIRFTKYTRALEGTAIREGTTARVVGIKAMGEVLLSNGRIISRRSGHWEHAYATTPQGLRGRRADRVQFAARSTDWAGLQRLDITAAADASRKDFRVFLEDEDALADVLDAERPRTSATDLTDRPEDFQLQAERARQRFEHMQQEDGHGRRFGR